MSKWNKNNAKPLTDQFIQNEERRRQMIIQASKKRREKQKRLQQINENMKKNQEEVLDKYKKQKQQAYNKYLKNNMHDKYEQMKRNQKLNQQPKRQVSKWKRKQAEESKNIEGLDLQRSNQKVVSQQKNKKKEEPPQIIKKGVQKKNVVVEQFQKQWGEENSIEDLIGSKLIDSLDLDIDTIERGRKITKEVKQKNLKQIQTVSKPPITTKQVEQLRNMIGYDSLLMSIDNCTQKQKVIAKQEKKQEKQKQKVPIQKKQVRQVNQQQAFNNLKHKKEAKILGWANKKVQEADDLFSNCSSNKNSVLNRPNTKDSKGRRGLQTIPQRATGKSKSVEKDKKNTIDSKKNLIPLDKVPPLAKNTSNNSNNSVEKTMNNKNEQKNLKNKSIEQRQQQKKTPQINNQNKNRSISKQKAKQIQQLALLKQRQKSLQKIKQRKFSKERATSGQKRRNNEQNEKIPKTQQPFKYPKNVPPIPKPTFTVATHEQYFDVQSFIMNDLVHLNEQQRKLQQQIRNIHLNNKQKVKQVQKKYEIKTDYKSTQNLIKYHNNQGEQLYSDNNAKYKNDLNEDLIEDSIQRLDDLLLKRQIQSRQKIKNQITQESHLKSGTQSIINPLSKPEDLYKQILQLADNISKFQNEPSEQVKGYGYMRKMKKPQKKQEINEQILSYSQNQQTVQKKPDPSRKNNLKMPSPPILQYSGRDNQLIQVNLQERYYDPQDSLQSMKKQKVKVNEKYKNILFD